MEKNLIVVYESEIGIPFVVKPVGDQVLLLSPGQDLIRLEVDNVNWRAQENTYVRNGESKFCYLGMTGEQISKYDMFDFLIRKMTFGFDDDYEAKFVRESLNYLGISCAYEPVSIDINLYEKPSANNTEFHYRCHGFDNSLCSAPNYLGEDLGISLKLIMETNFFPMLHVEVFQGGFSDASFESFKKDLLKVVGDIDNISLKFEKI